MLLESLELVLELVEQLVESLEVDEHVVGSLLSVVDHHVVEVSKSSVLELSEHVHAPSKGTSQIKSPSSGLAIAMAPPG